MTTATIPQLTYSGKPIAMNQVGELRRSDDVIGDWDALWERMEEDGYLFLPGYLDRREVLAARAELCDRLFKAGVLDPTRPSMEGVVATGKTVNPAATGPFMPVLARNNPPLDKVLHDGPMIDFYEFFLGGPGPALRLHVVPRQAAGHQHGDDPALRHRLYGPRHQGALHVVDAL